MKVLVLKSSPHAAPVYACRGCLDTETTLHELNDTDLVNAFCEFTGHYIHPSDGYPQYICKLCLYLLRKFVKFRHRCIKAMYLLQQLKTEVGVITTDSIKELDREKLRHNFVFTQIITLEISKAIDDVQIEPETLETPLPETEAHQNDDLVTNNEEIFDEPQDIPNNDSSDFDEDDITPLMSMKYDSDVFSDGEIENISLSCLKRMEEIEKEIVEGKCFSRKLKSYNIHVKKLMKEAKEFNLDVIFFTKEEQILELEEIRKSERFKDAEYKCEKCCAIYRTAEKLDRHAVWHNPSNGSFACEVCGLRYKTQNFLNSHYMKRHTNRIVCKTCGRVVTMDYKKHYEWHQGKHELYKCDQCNKQFTVKKQYLMHVACTHGGHLKGPECLLCNDGRGFSSEVGLAVHMIMVHKANPRCSSCKVVFADSDALTVHGNASGGCQTGYRSCPKCGENFTNETEMTTHFNEKHRKGCFKCPECPRQFQDVKKLRQHTRNHLNILSINSDDEKVTVDFERKIKNEKKITVDFERKKNNGNNKKLKNKYLKGVCEFCGKMLTYQTYVVHMRTHTGEKPFQCDICQKKFISKGCLQIHMVTHTGDRKFKCQICFKTFLQSSHLKNHMVTHSGEKPHECEICLKRFNYTATLREHIRTVHEGLPPSRKKRVRRRKENVAATQSIPSQMDVSEDSMCPEYLNEEMLD